MSRHDPCLAGCCKTPFGVCARQRTCWHHVDAQHSQRELDAAETRAREIRVRDAADADQRPYRIRPTR